MNIHIETAPDLFEPAVSLAECGFPVFPCKPDKSPLTPDGFKAATTVTAVVRDWWTRHPRALIGMPTGAASGVFVVDCDVDRETGEAVGEATLAALGADLTAAPSATTRSGGKHYFFRWREGLGNTAGRIGPKVDTRGEGGYVILAPSPGYRWNGALDLIWNGHRLPELPPEIAEALARKPRPEPMGDGLRFGIDAGNSGASRWAQSALADEIGRVAAAPEGERNATLNKAAFALGQIAAAGHLDGARVAAALLAAALGVGLGEAEARATVRSGMTAGAREPRHPPRREDWPRAGSPSTGASTGASTGSAEGSTGSARRLAPVTGDKLLIRPAPPREWLVPELVPHRNVTLFGGDGGTGKSLLAQQLAMAVAAGRPWLGRDVRAGPALFLTAEDELDEAHRRAETVAEREGLARADLARLHVQSLAGEDALLAALDRRTETLGETPLFGELDELTEAIRPALIVLDTLADLYGGDENRRTHVRQFVAMLRGLALRHSTAVVLLSHPSVAGMQSGSGLSGSTAWNGSVRSRLYLERIAEEGYEPDPDARRLTTKKANYAAAGREIALRWEAGVFVCTDPAPGDQLDRMAASARAERVFLKLLREFTAQGRFVNSAGGSNYAPKVFAEHPASEGCTKRALRAAMEALLAAGRLRIEAYGPPSRRVMKLLEA